MFQPHGRAAALRCESSSLSRSLGCAALSEAGFPVLPGDWDAPSCPFSSRCSPNQTGQHTRGWTRQWRADLARLGFSLRINLQLRASVRAGASSAPSVSGVTQTVPLQMVGAEGTNQTAHTVLPWALPYLKIKPGREKQGLACWEGRD